MPLNGVKGLKVGKLRDKGGINSSLLLHIVGRGVQSPLFDNSPPMKLCSFPSKNLSILQLLDWRKNWMLPNY